MSRDIPLHGILARSGGRLWIGLIVPVHELQDEVQRVGNTDVLKVEGLPGMIGDTPSGKLDEMFDQGFVFEGMMSVRQDQDGGWSIIAARGTYPARRSQEPGMMEDILDDLAMFEIPEEFEPG